jgi:hypothetical protein
MSTRIAILAGMVNIFISLFTWHPTASLAFKTLGIVCFISAYTLNRIEEKKKLKEQTQKELSTEELNKLIALIREICRSKYNLRYREIDTKFQSILSGYASRGFDLLPGTANRDITDLYVKEICAFSDIVSETMIETLNSVKFKIDPQLFIGLSREIISQKFCEFEKLHGNFVIHHFQTVPKDISTAMKEFFKKQAGNEFDLNISKIASQIELKNMA